MNPLTNIKNVQKLNDRELELGIIGKKSWHDEYKDSAWVFVGGLPFDLSEGDILCVFSQYGEIVNINLVRDHKTGKSKGFAFLCFEDQRSTVLSVDNLNGIKILGRTVRVDHVKDYKMPKEHGDEDELTKQVRSEGCAPKLDSSTEAEEDDDSETKQIEKKAKKKKKKKDKKKKKKREDSSSNDESPRNPSNRQNGHIKLEVKKEKFDPAYDMKREKYDPGHDVKKEKYDPGYDRAVSSGRIKDEGVRETAGYRRQQENFRSRSREGRDKGRDPPQHGRLDSDSDSRDEEDNSYQRNSRESGPHVRQGTYSPSSKDDTGRRGGRDRGEDVDRGDSSRDERRERDRGREDRGERKRNQNDFEARDKRREGSRERDRSLDRERRRSRERVRDRSRERDRERDLSYRNNDRRRQDGHYGARDRDRDRRR